MTGIRLHCIVEGQTEEAFVNQVIRPHLAERLIWVNARPVLTSRKRGVKFGGGFRSYAQPHNDIRQWLNQDRNDDARFTTLFDLYRLPNDFPGYACARVLADPYAKVEMLEDSLGKDIKDERFIPYLQLHEFEALLFADPRKLEMQFENRGNAIERLSEQTDEVGNPELINEGQETAPSKRIIAQIPAYAKMKSSAGPIVAQHIGLPCLRSACRHFGDWIDRLEKLN